MSYYLQIGAAGGPTHIASNVGYRDLCEWVEGLDVGDYGQLAHLCQHAWCQNLDGLAKQIKAALENEEPDKDTREVAETISDLLDNRDESATVATVTDGIGEE